MPLPEHSRSRRLPIILGEGFYSDEGNWRWMGPTGNIHIRPEILPATIYFELSCGQPEYYPHFPFELNIYVGETLAEKLTFQTGERTQGVELPLEAGDTGIHLRLESSEFFVPSLCSASADVRQLSVRLSHLQVEASRANGLTEELEEGQDSLVENEVSLGEQGISVSGSQRHCPLCKGGTQRELLGFLESSRNLGPKKYCLFLCSNCELIYLSPLPQKEVLEDLYIGNTQFIEATQYTGKRAQLAMTYYQDRVRALLERMNSIRKPIRLLEIGSGLSWISRAAKVVNPLAITVAQDITSEAVSICKWVDHYFVGEWVDKLSEISRFAPYHIVSMTHVIEHLPDPIEVLKACLPLLGPKALVFVTAPYRPKSWTSHSSFSLWKRWNYNHVPAHLQYFNAPSMKKCAAQSGLELIYFDATPDEGQAFEAWLSPPGSKTDEISGNRNQVVRKEAWFRRLVKNF